MPKNLMIVESPNKIKTIQPLLGDDWKVMASVGHIRDLPQGGDMGIDIPGFTLNYEYIPSAPKPGGGHWPGGEERLNNIRRAMREAHNVYLATDLDREGEAISWHLKECLGLGDSDYLRVTFDEISRNAILKALEDGRLIDDGVVHAQEARRAIDRIVGWEVTPLLSNMLGMNVSAGRVQSVAVRLVVDLERQIKAFKKTKHFGAKIEFDKSAWAAEWNTKPFVNEESPYVLNEELANRAANSRQFEVVKSETTDATSSPPAPFTTSSMLQAASDSLKMDPNVATKAAQKLFEQGLVTYIRTDSVSLSDDAISAIRELANEKGWPVPGKPRKFRSKDSAQEAHEAIRPYDVTVSEAGSSKEEQALYRLIWERTVASQLGDARYKVTSLTLKSTDAPQEFEYIAKGRVMVEPGWRVITDKNAIEDDDDQAADATGKVPMLEVGSVKVADSGKLLRKETEPPRRYSLARLIKKLEHEGIGRPSSFNSIMTNITSRAYVVEEKRLLVPSEIGELIVDNLVEAGFSFMELEFTRDLEKQLDEVAAQRLTYLDVVEPFYERLKSELIRIATSGEFKPRFVCPKCSTGMRRYNHAQRGPFWCCTNEDCKHFMDDDKGRPVPRLTHPCPKCSTALRRYKKKSSPGHVWVCPAEECETFLDDLNGKPLPAQKCPKCTSALRRYQKKDKQTGKPKGGHGWFCTNDECKTYMEDDKGKPVAIKTAPCPSCGKNLVRRKTAKGWWWPCSGYQDGCQVVMDDDNGKPVPRGTAKPASKGSGTRSGTSKAGSKMPAKLQIRPITKK